MEKWETHFHFPSSREDRKIGQRRFFGQEQYGNGVDQQKSQQDAEDERIFQLDLHGITAFRCCRMGMSSVPDVGVGPIDPDGIGAALGVGHDVVFVALLGQSHLGGGGEILIHARKVEHIPLHRASPA